MPWRGKVERPLGARGLLRRTLRRQRRPVLAGAALIAIWAVCEAMVPVLIGVVIDRAVATGDLLQLALWVGALCLLFTVLSYAYRFGSRTGFGALQRESHLVRTEVSAHVLADRGARPDRLPGDVLSLATADAEMVAVVVRQVTLTAGAAVGLVVSSVVLVVIDPVLAIVVLVGVPTVLACTQVLAPRLARRSETRQASIARASGVAADLVSGLRPLKGIGGEGTALARYRVLSRQAARASVESARSEGLLFGTTTALSGVFLALVALVAGTRALDGDLGVGELVAVVGLALFIAEPLELMAVMIAQTAESRASAGRLATFLATPPLVLAGERADVVDPVSLDLDGVAFGTLRDLTLHVAPGGLVAVVAEDPSDAAALMTLLRGEARPDRGALCLGGVPLTGLRLDEVRRRLLVADHQVDLFEGSLRSNIDPLGALDDARLEQVLAASAARDVVDHAPAGLDEPVTVGGTTLSGGQRQRVALARALAADPPLLVLHDPVTAVDGVTGHRIARSLRATRQAEGVVRTTVVLTDSPALLAQADVVVHVREGRVVGRGRHHDLVADAAYSSAVLR